MLSLTPFSVALLQKLIFFSALFALFFGPVRSLAIVVFFSPIFLLCMFSNFFSFKSLPLPLIFLPLVTQLAVYDLVC
jgi:hypothetical protein